MLLLAGPLALPVLTALCQPQSFAVFSEWEAISELLANTALLALLAVLVAAPLGAVLAVAVARGPALPARLRGEGLFCRSSDSRPAWCPARPRSSATSA